MQPTTDVQVGGSIPGRPADLSALPNLTLVQIPLSTNFSHLTPPHPTPPPQETDIQFQGIETSE